MQQHHKILYYNLLTSGSLRLVKEYAEREGVTEQLKAENQMEWVCRMNNIRERVNEVVNAEMIFS